MSVSENIRHATMADFESLSAIEAACFPPAEAASSYELQSRLTVHPDFFWLLTEEQTIISFINGFATDCPDLTDDMYADATLHNPEGEWQMIFGVDTDPRFQHRGHASTLMHAVIEDTKAAGRRGLVLTCKEHLIGFYQRFGYIDEGISSSTHGNVRWHQMRLTFDDDA